MGQRSSNIQIIAHSDDVFDPGEVFALSVKNVWYGGDNSNRASGTPVTPGTVDAGGTIRVIDTNASSGDTYACR